MNGWWVNPVISDQPRQTRRAFVSYSLLSRMGVTWKATIHFDPTRGNITYENKNKSSTNLVHTAVGPKAKLIQQTFHEGMFLSRRRSNSLSEITTGSRALTLSSKEPVGMTSNQGTFNPEWQRVPTMRSSKRRRTSDSPPHNNLIKSNNRYDGLATDVPEPLEIVKTIYKPPPFILYGIEDVNKDRKSVV